MTRNEDRWAAWLRHRRSGGDHDVERMLEQRLADVRDRVLDRSALEPGETLLDVGCGRGLIAFGAIERGAASVVFSDVSVDLLDECRVRAEELGLDGRCRFVQAAADDLAAIESGSVDVVTTRSVLIYVADKPRAFAEFHRVLRPGGRISLYEPINRFGSPSTPGTLCGYEVGGLDDVIAKIEALYDELQPPTTDPMLDFDERDLIELAETARFFPVELELRAEIGPTDPLPWESFVNSAGNPNIPPLREAMEQVLTPGETDRLSERLRPLVEEGRGVGRRATAHLWAARP